MSNVVFLYLVIMKFLKKTAIALGVIMQGDVHASVITVEFDLTITSKYDLSQGSQLALPVEHQFASIRFDNTLTRVDREWNPSNVINSHVLSIFGSPGQTVIVSPLEDNATTNPIPQAPVVATSVMGGLMWYQLAPPDYKDVSFGRTIYATSTLSSATHPNGPYAYEGETWNSTVTISSPVEYLGPMDGGDIASYDFVSQDLMSYLTDMEARKTRFDFRESISYENRPTLLLSGYVYKGQATITRIINDDDNKVPEPNSIALIGAAISALAFTRRRKM